MRTTVELPDELFHQLKARAVQENISLKLIIEKSGYEYLSRPLRRWHKDDITLPKAGDGTGRVLVDPPTWWDDINERA